jgi:hypothetical protein
MNGEAVGIAIRVWTVGGLVNGEAVGIAMQLKLNNDKKFFVKLVLLYTFLLQLLIPDWTKK